MVFNKTQFRKTQVEDFAEVQEHINHHFCVIHAIIHAIIAKLMSSDGAVEGKGYNQLKDQSTSIINSKMPR